MSEKKGKPHENTARVLLTWTNLQMETNSDFKENWLGVGEGGILSPPPYAADPILIMYPLKLRGYMISIGAA